MKDVLAMHTRIPKVELTQEEAIGKKKKCYFYLYEDEIEYMKKVLNEYRRQLGRNLCDNTTKGIEIKKDFQCSYRQKGLLKDALGE